MFFILTREEYYGPGPKKLTLVLCFKLKRRVPTARARKKLTVVLCFKLKRRYLPARAEKIDGSFVLLLEEKIL